jgi:hypothetical protein
MTPSALVSLLAAPTFAVGTGTALAFLFAGGLAIADDAPLEVAVYDAPPYRHVEPDGSTDGVSVDGGAAQRKVSNATIGAIAIAPARFKDRVEA